MWPLTREVFHAKKRAFSFSEEYSKTNMENCGGPKSNSILIPTVEIKAAFTVWLLHSVYSFSCENGEDLCYILQSNLFFLEINTRCSETYRKKASKACDAEGFTHACNVVIWPGEGGEYLTRQGCQNFPPKTWPFTLPWPQKGTCCYMWRGGGRVTKTQCVIPRSVCASAKTETSRQEGTMCEEQRHSGAPGDETASVAT